MPRTCRSVLPPTAPHLARAGCHAYRRARAGRRGWVFVLLLLIGTVFLVAVWRQLQPAAVVAAPNVFGGLVNGGCYLVTATTCKVHVDAWQPIPISQGEQLVAFQLRATGQNLYDFRTDVSNPPTGSYLPSLVRQDFAITCGESYVLTLLAQDTGDASLTVVGQTNAFTCPAAATRTATPSPPPPNESYVWIPAFWR